MEQLATPFLRPRDAARYLTLAEQTLAAMRSEGRGPAYTKLGRAVVYDVRDLDAWIEAQGKRTFTVSAPHKVLHFVRASDIAGHLNGPIPARQPLPD